GNFASSADTSNKAVTVVKAQSSDDAPLSAPSHPLIELRAVSKIYHMGEIEVRALKSVDFSVGFGEMVAIMGASGSGKSTMLNLIGALDRPTEGEYLLDGEPVQDLDEYDLAAV